MIRRHRIRRSGTGYSMVFLLMAVTLMTIMTAQALPNWTAISQREKEEELIFRGFQYAEAIRVFQRRFGRYPVRLKELIDVKPRCIRQLWTDPMNEDGDWGLIFAGGPGQRAGGRRGQQVPGQVPGDNGGQGDSGEVVFGDGGDPNGSDGNGLPQSFQPQSQGFGRRQEPVGPIVGVYSRASSEQSFKVFMDQESYDLWAFTADMLSGVATAPDRPPQVPSAATLGRPFPEGITPLITFAPGNQGGQGGQPNRGGNLPGAQGPQGQDRRNRGGFGVPAPSNQQRRPANPLGRNNQR